MSTPKGDLLIGRIALREKLITREQLYDCLLAQERNPSKTLGAIMVSRGYLKEEDVERIVTLQKRAFLGSPEGPEARRRGALLGKVLLERGLATEYQVNEALRLQGRMADLGIRPLPQLGEILIRRGYLDKGAVETALQLQNLDLYTCPACGEPVAPGEGPDAGGQVRCTKCATEVPGILAKMATAVKTALDQASREHDIEVPEEVRQAARDRTKHFGKYVLLKEIGRGGAGIVYKAWQQDLNKIVALKVLPHESDTAAGIKTPFGDVEDVKRFYNETRAHAELKHPNIVPILDFGLVESHYYYTMKYIQGMTLDGAVREGIDERAFQTTQIIGLSELKSAPAPETRSIVKGRGMALKTALSIARDVALAVDYAHQRGVVHRDIKPGNIIIDGTGKPWLMDFGLAKVNSIGDSAYVKGVIMGTPYYMPPEQAMGDMEQVDDLSDIFSLGAVLYEMVCGYSPYHGKSSDEVLTILPREAPDPVTAFVPNLPRDVVTIVERAMCRDRSGRYSSAATFAADVEAVLAGRPLKRARRPKSIWKRVRNIFGDSD